MQCRGVISFQLMLWRADTWEEQKYNSTRS